jgi:parallel beta-helix repeat protein
LGEKRVFRRITLAVMLALFSISMLVLSFHIQPVKASSATIIVPNDYPTIQEAINNANEGDTIIVSAGTYYENIVLHKSVNLLGESSYTTILDGKGVKDVVDVTANNVTIEGFTIRNGKVGIHLISVTNSLIRRNNVRNNQDGIDVTSSWNATIIENNSSNNIQRGIYFEFSWNGNVESNIIEENGWYGLNLFNSLNSSIIGNSVKGKRGDFDAIGLYLSRNCIVVGNTASDSGFGVWLESSTNIVVEGNDVYNNGYGISLTNSIQNVIKQNDVRTSRGYNLGLYSSNMNTFYHNNFVATITKQVESQNSNNTMHNDTWKEGNYWNDYNGEDHNNDGIGDTSYIIGTDESDRYPLMAKFTNFPINRESEVYNVEVISNSTISNFEFNADKNEMKFRVSGENTTHGFCRIGIPKTLMDGILIVKVDGNTSMTKKLVHPNLEFNYLYFTYIHSIHQITITLETSQGFSVLQLLILLFTTIALLLVALILVLKIKRKNFHLRMRRRNVSTMNNGKTIVCYRQFL